jgi:hypothetical protein
MGSPSNVDARAPHLSHDSAAGGHAAMGARSVVPRAPFQRAGRAGHGPAPPVGRGNHCAEAIGWATRRCALAVGPSFSPSDVKSFSIFEWI